MYLIATVLQKPIFDQPDQSLMCTQNQEKCCIEKSKHDNIETKSTK